MYLFCAQEDNMEQHHIVSEPHDPSEQQDTAILVLKLGYECFFLMKTYNQKSKCYSSDMRKLLFHISIPVCHGNLYSFSILKDVVY